MKALMMAIKPKWVKKIASGEKTVEVRKRYPHGMMVPFKVYIYESMDGGEGAGVVVGDFECNRLVRVLSHPDQFAGKPLFHSYAVGGSCLTEEELLEYSGGKDLYGFVISKLRMYDKPKSISEFHRNCDDCLMEPICNGCMHIKTAPPQSWYYVEELGE